MLGTITVRAQKLTLQAAMTIAQENSLDAQVARYSFMSSYWQYRSFKAQLMPSVNLSAGLVGFNHSIVETRNYDDGRVNHVNNNSMKNFSIGHKMQKNNNLVEYPFDNYLYDFVDVNNNIQQHKRNTKSYDKYMNNRVYAGIHNINNNINNININNINYDGKRLSDGFNNFNNLGELDMNMNYHRTQDNFYDPGNLLNNKDLFNDFY